MRKTNPIIFFVVIIAVSCTQKSEWVSTTENHPWVKEKGLKITSAFDSVDVVVDTAAKLQTIEGFGGCFNELGWIALQTLSQFDRDEIFKELFEPGVGASFNICRMPIGANDFSRDWYSYDETEGDFDMNNFSIRNDLSTLVPFIKNALKKKPDLTTWASPWSPPSWMKWNKHYACRIPWPELAPQYRNHLAVDKQGREGTNMFIQKDSYFKAYSLYFTKFIEAYYQQGITISAVMPQNEFNSCQIFPSCTWTAGGLATFIGKYLGPALQKQNVEIMFGTMERPAEALVDTIINDPLAGKYVKGVGFQWAGKEAIPGIHKRYLSLKLYQSEQECGDGKNDWKYCLYAWSLMKYYFINGVNAYMYWNIALKEGGYSRWGWQQNSLITVDTLKKTYHYNHEYYLMKHLSHFVKPGAKLLKTEGSINDLLAFQNPDKSIVLVLYCEKGRSVKIRIGTKLMVSVFKPGSFNTILLKSKN
jgi:glucosylceramidase